MHSEWQILHRRTQIEHGLLEKKILFNTGQ